jgi:hypothetical protein
MRTFVSLQALATFDLDQVQKAFDQQVTFDDTDSITAALEQSGLVTLAASALSVPFNFGSVTSASTLLVIAYQEVQLQLDSILAPLVSVRPIPANPPPGVVSRHQRQDQPGLVMWRGKVSSLFLSNPSAVASAKAFVAVVGNALP